MYLDSKVNCKTPKFISSLTGSRWARRIVINVLCLFCLYLVGGFLGVPLALRYIALAKVNDKILGTIEVERFRFNPFTCELKIEDFTGTTSDGKVAASFAQFRVHLQPSSFFSDCYVVHELILDQPHCDLHISQSGQLNLASLFGSKQQSPAKDPSEPFVIPSLLIGQLEVRNAGLQLQAETADHSFEREAKDISFVMKDLSTDARNDNPYRFSLATTAGEQLEITGSLRLDPLSSIGSVSLKSLKLPDFSRFGSTMVNAEIASGVIDVSFDYRFRPLAVTPELGVTNGKLALQDFSLQTPGNEQPPYRINALSMDGFCFDLVGQSMRLDSLNVDAASLLLVRDSEGQIKLVEKASPQPSSDSFSDKQLQRPRRNARSKKTQLGVVAAYKDIGEAIAKAAELFQKLNSNEHNAKTWANAFAMNLRRCSISNSTVHIRDESVQPPVDLEIRDITMTMGPYVSPAEQVLELDLAMSLAGSASGHLQIKGSMLPAKPFKSTHLEISADGVSIPSFAGYSVAVLGHAPTGGGVKAQLNYHMDNGLIEGSSGLEIEQMEFGPRVQDSDAPHLPLKLAIAILKDSDGMVALDIPVSGDINHPKFSYGSMITYALHNVITKIATAPLSVLSGLFPDGDGVKQDFIEFEAGQTSPPKSAANMLTKLAQIMESRPGLTIQLSPSFSPKEDAQALSELRFEQSVTALIAKGEDRKGAIKKLHKGLSKKERAPGFLPDRKEMEAADRKSFHVTQADLLKLAEDRALGVRELLMTQGGINASRIEIKAPTESTTTRVSIAFNITRQ